MCSCVQRPCVDDCVSNILVRLGRIHRDMTSCEHFRLCPKIENKKMNDGGEVLTILLNLKIVAEINKLQILI